MYRRPKIHWVAVALVLLGLFATVPSLAQLKPHPPAPVAKIVMVLSGGECLNCAEAQPQEACEVSCVMPLAVTLTNPTDGVVVFRLTVAITLRNDAVACGNGDDLQTGTYTLAAHSWMRIDFSHTFSGEFRGALFTASGQILTSTVPVRMGSGGTLEFDAVVPLCGAGEDEQ